ncbi:amidohydrolase family protein [Methermicoccus shengliensis]|uniref:Amidohydrolase family protein n=1 Tax=Methermicoccus shengliensis TaxID=660064 RepID=A0A832RT04_9EURY|nr:amidohydrolase family protein [Methermicoccus shengliensis]KUK04346.1 MAG: Amidohydrolase [Euryarchaeota archaeon 55_53]KUK30161.1 MAG: Amidohydrolase [Methanosarcinales archeaon 56_1174]MDI3488325.1 hypothetical protein [Methanosarcinales archaeon]MDN5294786.1 hypothetical protein [Methanosarcinales archaeon]HIH69838.1 amidohydrolase family protein [Methermicoccus shengliensis]
MDSRVLEGKLLSGERLELTEGRVVIEDGVIVDVAEGRCELPYLIAPSIFNAHTHVGDGVFKDPPLGGLDELVKPPHGLKHRVLSHTPRHQKIEAMRLSAIQMLASGCTGFADFREEGVDGVLQLDEAVQGMCIQALSFGRPDGDDVGELLSVCDGLGISGCHDHPWDALMEWASACRHVGKMLCIHAGEKDGEDVDAAIELEPDVLVHMVHASDAELRRCADEDISIVVCVRSNMLTGVGVPRVKRMLELGINVGCGTDNVMLASCDPFEEMHALSWVLRLGEEDVLSMLTWRARRAYGLGGGVIEEGEPADLMVLDLSTPNLRGCSNPLRSLVRRAQASDVCAVYARGREVINRGG